MTDERVPADQPRRRKRLERDARAKRRVVLHDGDVAIFLDLYRARLLSSDQICAIFPPERRNELPYSDKYDPNEPRLNRLRDLFDGKYLDRLPYGASDEERGTYGGSQRLIYALGRDGASALRRRYPNLPVRTLDNDLKALFIDHQLQISNVFTTVRVAERLGLHRGLAFWEEGHKLQDSFYTDDGGHWKESPTPAARKELVRHRVEPDAFFCLKFAGEGGKDLGLNYFLEADRSNMPHGKMATKYLAYFLWFRHRLHTEKLGISFFVVLTVCVSPERRDELRKKVAARIDPPGKATPLFWFCSERDFSSAEPERFLGPIWYTPGSDTPRGLLS